MITPHLACLPPLVLTFSAADPSGGAGLQADVLTISALGCHPLSVATAITVQDTVGVAGIMAVPADWVARQARRVLADMSVAAFKIGLLGSVENIAPIAQIIAEYPGVPLVLDPILASGRGDELADQKMIAGLRERLLPLTTVLTPNTLEARRLSVGDEEDPAVVLPLAECARRLLHFGCRYVLLTGTHASSEQVVNRLYEQRSGLLRQDVWPRLPGEYHGSGCTLAAAVAACLATGMPVGEAVRAAQEYTWQSLAAGFRPGAGQYIPDRNFELRARRAAGDE